MCPSACPAASWELLSERWGWGSLGPVREDTRDPPTAQNIHSQMTLGNSAPALRVTGLAFEHDCCKGNLCSPDVLEVHPPEPKQKNLLLCRMSSWHAARTRAPHPTALGWPCPAAPGSGAVSVLGASRGRLCPWSTVSSSPGCTGSERGGCVCAAAALGKTC